MDGRERVRAIFDGEVPDRVGYEDAFWNESIARGRAGGLPPDAQPIWYIDSLNYVDPIQTFPFPERIIEETVDYTIRFDAEGVTREDLKAGRCWIPNRLSCTLESQSDWRALEERSRPSPELIIDMHAVMNDRGLRCDGVGWGERYKMHEECPVLFRSLSAAGCQLQ